MEKSISVEQKKFVDEVLKDESYLDDVTNDELLKLVTKLQDDPPEFRERKIDYGEEELTVYFVSKYYTSVKKLLDLIEVSKLHANLQVPDVGAFMARRLTLGGYKSVIGGIFMGAGVMQNPVVTSSVILLSRGGSNFLANPKNIDLALNALNTTAPRTLRYKAAIDLLSRKVRDTTNPEEKKFFQAMEEEFKDNKDFILDTLGD